MKKVTEQSVLAMTISLGDKMGKIIKQKEQVIKELFEVIEKLQLNRMPTRSEVSDYFGNESLTNIISKRYTWGGLARELNLQSKESETNFGKIHEEKAKKHLIGLGYRVDSMPQNFPYDLLVNDCLKIDVKVSKLYKGKKDNFYSCNLGKMFTTCDIYIVYLISEKEEMVAIIPSKFVSKNTQISIGEFTSKYHKFLNKWEYIDQYLNFLEGVE